MSAVGGMLFGVNGPLLLLLLSLHCLGALLSVWPYAHVNVACSVLRHVNGVLFQVVRGLYLGPHFPRHLTGHPAMAASALLLLL